MSAPILSAYDWEMSQGFIRHLRAGFLDAGNNGKLQFRYVYSDGSVEWIDLVTALTSVSFNFTSWWDLNNSQGRLLFVNGLPQIWEWSGGITTLASISTTAGAVTSVQTGTPPFGLFLPDAFGGKDYTAGDVLTIASGNNDATVQVESVLNGAIYSINTTPTHGGTGYQVGDVIVLANGLITAVNSVPNSGGTSYTVGDILSIQQQGASGGTVQVSSVDGSGVVLSVTLQAIGSGYVPGANLPTTGGTGTGCTIQILTIATNGRVGGTMLVETVGGSGDITSISLRSQGQGYSVVGTNQAVANGSGVGATIEVTEIDNGAIETVSLLNGGTGYSTGNNVSVTGGSGSAASMQILSVNNNSITKQGTTTFAQEGFYDTGTHEVTIDGVVYTVTGGWGSQTLTGVTPDPTGLNVGDLIFQTPEIFLNANIPGLPPLFPNALIQTFDQQLYIGSLTDNSIYVSEINNYLNFAPPTGPIARATGDPIVLIANSPIKAFISQEDLLYVSAGISQWYTVSQNSISTEVTASGPPATVLNINVITPVLNRLKTTSLQGTQSQAFVSKNKNDVIFVSFEPIVNSLGRVEDVVLTPQIADLSFSIVNDMNSYDLTDGSIFFWQNFIIVAVPKENLIRLYNMTKDTTTQNPTNDPIHYWEAPLTMPFSRFSVIDGDLYGHSYLVSETYKMFEGYNFDGHPIPASAVFAYQQFGVRPQNKSENEYYIEGYISPNTTLDMTVNYELDGVGGQYNGTIVGTDTQIVQVPGNDNSLGKESLGKNPLGGNLVIDTTPTNKFRVIKTFPRTPYYEASPIFSSTGIDYIWSLIAFGPVQTPTSEGNNPITQ